MDSNGYPLRQASQDYERIERAIRFLEQHLEDQPELDDLAAEIGLSPYHLHRLFSRWVGTTPKRFLQFLSVEHAKERLHATESVLEAAWDTGLSSGGRLHDLMVTVEAVTPGEYKRHGADLEIRCGVHPSPFGECLVGITDRGICALEFLSDRSADNGILELGHRWPGAVIRHDPVATRELLPALFPGPAGGPRGPFTLYIKGTNFQLQVWQALLRIPAGTLTTYGAIARHLDKPGASRAVGQAVGWNPISYLIPCHRVISSTTGLGGYRWGLPRKRALLAWEAAGAEAPA